MMTWLLDTLFWMTVLMVLVLSVRGQVARHFGQQAAYCLWLIPAARAFMPVRETSASLFTAARAPAGVADAVRDAVFSAPVKMAASPALIDWTTILIGTWLSGAALLMLFELRRYLHFRTAILCDADVMETQNRVHIVKSAAVTGPVAFGIFRKYIAVPIDFSQDFTSDERAFVIAHEMSHHRAGDLLVNFGAFLMLCLHWFNPVAWASWRAFRFDQEAACDARVLIARTPHEREVYAHTLTKSATRGRLTFASALTPQNTLVQRLRILTMKEMPKNRRLIGIACIGAAIAVTLPFTATVIAAPADPATAPKIEKSLVRTIVIRPEGAHAQKEGDVKVEHKIVSNGSTIIIKADHKLSDEELAKITEDAKSDTLEPSSAGGVQKTHRKVIVQTIHHGETKSETDSAYNITPHVPEIDIKEVVANCKDGESVTTNAEATGDDGKAKVTIITCGKGNGKMARLAAVDGLKDALASIKDQDDMPESVRKDVIEKLNAQIKRLEKEAAEDKT